MPYTERSRRPDINIDPIPRDVGDLTYLLTWCCAMYLRSCPVRYDRLADVLGALEATKLELNRRVLTPYEQIKLKANGDVQALEDVLRWSNLD